jgi:hypothetical protein
MPKIINFAARPNLKYPLQYLIYGAIRDLETTLLGEFLDYLYQIYCIMIL